MGISVHAHGERSLQLTKAFSMLARDALKHKEKTFEPSQGGKYYSLLLVGLFLHIIKVTHKVLPSPIPNLILSLVPISSLLSVIHKVLPSPIPNLILSLVPISSLLLVIHKVQKLGDEIIKTGDQ
jgi:hypothetical protein